MQSPSKGLAIVCSFPRSLLSLLVTDDMIYIDCCPTPDTGQMPGQYCGMWIYSNWQQMVPSPHKITANHQNTETPEMWCICICSQYHITLTKFPQNRYAMHVHCTYKQRVLLRWATSIQSMMLNVQKSISSRQTDTKVTKILRQTRRGGCGWCGDGNVSRLQKLDGIDLIKRNSEWQSH